MAVAIILLAIISLFAVGIATLTFQQAAYQLLVENDFWDAGNIVDSDLRIAKDQLYDATIAIPIFAIGGIALWAYLSVNRNEDL